MKSRLEVRFIILLTVLLYSNSCNHSGFGYHRVSKGETLYRISRIYGIDVNDLMRSNGISRPQNLKVGKLLYIPGRSRKNKREHNINAYRKESAPNNKPVSLSLKNKFSWPVKGKVLTRFGNGLNNHYDGINIQSRYGNEVKAASPGEVLYSGNGLKGYGNMIILKHSNRVYSIYALNSENLVSRGDMVKRHQAIAKVGGLPKIGKSFLHFQIRTGKRAIDPLRVLE